MIKGNNASTIMTIS